MKFFFDKEGDVLDIAIGKPKKAISRKIGNDIVVRIDPKTKEIVGFTILNFPSFTLGCDNNYILAIILYRCYSFLAII